MIFSELEILDQRHLKVDKVQVCTRRPPIGAPATPEVDQIFILILSIGVLKGGGQPPIDTFYFTWYPIISISYSEWLLVVLCLQGGRSCAGARVAPAEKFGLGRKF